MGSIYATFSFFQFVADPAREARAKLCQLQVVRVAKGGPQGRVAHDLGGLIEVAGISLELHPEGVSEGMGRDALGDAGGRDGRTQHEADPIVGEARVPPRGHRVVLSQEERSRSAHQAVGKGQIGVDGQGQPGANGKKKA